MAESPTSRTLKLLRKQGWTAGVVEKWIPQTRRRLDFLGGIDIIAVSEQGTVGVQCTTVSNQANRRAKLCAEPQMAAWLAGGNKLWVIGWAKKGAKGKRKIWQSTFSDITKDDLTPADLTV